MVRLKNKKKKYLKEHGLKSLSMGFFKLIKETLILLLVQIRIELSVFEKSWKIKYEFQQRTRI